MGIFKSVRVQMNFESLIAEQLRGASLARTRGGLVPSAPRAPAGVLAAAPSHPRHLSRPGTAGVDAVGPTSSTSSTSSSSSSSSSFARGRQKARIDALDRRCLSLFATVEDVQRTLLTLEVTCSRQSLESEVRRAAVDLVRPAITAMHEQMRADLVRIMNEVASVSSKAASAFNAASAARAEVSALTAAQAVPSVHRILDGTVARGVGPRSARLADGSAYFRSHRDYEKECENEESRQELMWERIDNHLACHEMRLRQKIEDVVQAALLRSSVAAQVQRKEESASGKSSQTGQSPIQIGDEAVAQNHGPSTFDPHRNARSRHAWDAEEFVPVRDFLLLQRRLDEVVVAVHDLPKPERVETLRKLARGARGAGGAGEVDHDELNMALNVQKDDSVAGESRARAQCGAGAGAGPDGRGGPHDEDGQSAVDQNQVVRDMATEVGPTSSTLSSGAFLGGIPDFQRKITVLQAQVLEMRDDLISVKLESSSRLSRLLKLEQHVHTLHDALSQVRLRQDGGTQSLETAVVASSLTVPLMTAVPLECIGGGKSMYEWGVAEVDQWLLLIGTIEAVRRRFFELEIDGEMLSLLEKSDLEGSVGEGGVKTGMDIAKAMRGTPEEGAAEVDRLLREIAKLKCAHGIPISPGAESVATDGEEDDGTSLIYGLSTGSPASSLDSPHASSAHVKMSTASTTRNAELDSIRKQLASYGYNNL